MRNKAGFTLIEIMVSLVLVGLIATISGTAVITATRSYLFAKENDAITQKAQLALGRLNREFIELSEIKDANGTCVVYESPNGRRAVAKVGSAVHFFSDYAPTTCPSTGGDILVNEVQTFSIMYNPSSGVSLWSMGQDIRNLFAVSVQIVLARPDTGGSVPFYTTVSPRNNNNSGGASLPTAANPPPEYSGKQCFVTTAAYGDADHPVVEVLRQFRDRVLLPTDPGKALVRYYYEVGPSLAAAIEDKPIACLLIRLLVTPLAGFALLTMSCPVLIPVILLLSWGLARLTLRALERRSLRWTNRLQGQRGAMLVTMIAAMVTFAALGAVMIGMFGTSALSQVAGNSAMKAYYLAESGFRYAASRYIAVDLGSETANETERNRLIRDDLHAKTFTMNAGDGNFKLNFYPYYYRVNNILTNQQLMDTEVFDWGYPVDLLNYKNGSWIKIKKPDGSIIYDRILAVSLIFPRTVQFTRLSGTWDASITSGSEVTPVCVPDTAANPTLTDIDGDGVPDLRFVANTGADAFPPRNGIFTVRVQGSSEPRMLSYKELDTGSTVRLLKGVSDPNGGSVAGLALDTSASNYVELTKFMRVESTGTFGTGSAAVNRKVTFYAPIGYARATPISKTQPPPDTFADLSKWFTGYNVSHAGTQSLSSMYGGVAMTVGSLAATGPSNCLNTSEFQIGLNWSGAIPPIPLSTEWLRASRYLSYDVQVKLGQFANFSSSSQAFGLNFRIDETGNTLGLSFGSFQPGLDSNGCEKDYIPEGMIAPASGYVDSTPVITLWAKQYDKMDSAFTVVPNPGPQVCLGHPPATTGHYTIVPANLAAWETGNRVRLAPAGGGALPGGIVENRDYFTRKITTSGVDYIYLFDSRSDAVAKESGCWLWNGLQDMTNAGSGARTATNQNALWTNLAYQTLTPGTAGNEFLGLSSSTTSMQFVKTWSTGLVRLIEAPSVSVVSGGGSTGSEIRSGDTVYTTSDNSQAGTLVASARVQRNPVYRSASSSVRDWTGGNAQAVLILEVLKDSGNNSLPHLFGQGKTLFVGGHPGGRNAGIVGIPGSSTDIVYRSRDNWIAVYVGDISGKEPMGTDPYDIYRGPLLRTSVRWPVDAVEDTSSGNDYFTIVRFGSFLNSTLLCKVSDGIGLMDMSGVNCLSGFYSKTNTGTAPDILRFSSPDGVLFNSPSSGSSLPVSRAEVGLHAYAVTSIFYDDFAMQFGPGYGITRQGFLLPIQQ